MPVYIGYALLGAGLLTFLVSLFVDSRTSMPLKFAAIVFALSGLVILQFMGVGEPTP